MFKIKTVQELIEKYTDKCLSINQQLEKELEQRDKNLIEFVVTELFAPDGPLRLEHDVHIKPSDRLNVKRWIRQRVHDETDIKYSKKERVYITDEEFSKRLVNLIKEEE